MLTVLEADPNVTLAQQLTAGGGPVVLVAHFKVDPARTDQFVSIWQADAAYYTAQPGCVSAQLHRGIAGSGSFMNYAVWESVDLFRKALNPKLMDAAKAYPDGSSVALHLYRKVAVAGICGA